MNYSKIIDEITSRDGISKSKLSEIIGIDSSNITKWVDGKAKPSGSARTILIAVHQSRSMTVLFADINGVDLNFETSSYGRKIGK